MLAQLGAAAAVPFVVEPSNGQLDSANLWRAYVLCDLVATELLKGVQFLIISGDQVRCPEACRQGVYAISQPNVRASTHAMLAQLGAAAAAPFVVEPSNGQLHSANLWRAYVLCDLVATRLLKGVQFLIISGHQVRCPDACRQGVYAISQPNVRASTHAMLDLFT